MKKIIVLLLLLSGMFGCNKILDKTPLTSITAENFFKNSDDAESAITGCYDALQNDEYYGSEMNKLGEMPSDNCSSSNGDVFSLDKLTWNSSNTGSVNRLFQFPYRGINRANTVLKYLSSVPMDTVRRNQIMGEAYFLRGLHYFNLVKIYGGVPIRLTPTESGTSQNPGQATADQVFAQVESDLSMAESLTAKTFGNTSLNRTRVIKTAVNALQARVYLTERKWDKAIAAANKVTQSSEYVLSGNFNDNFPPKNKPESIFEVQYSGNNDGGFTLPDLILPSPPAVYSFPKFNIPTNELIQAMDTVNDSRWKFSGNVNFTKGDNTQAYYRNYGSVIHGNVANGNDGGFFVYKWRNTNFFNSSDNYIVLRLADVYLMYAEASNEQIGPNQLALDKLNAIRTRAGLVALTLADLFDKQTFRNEVDQQRRAELAFEGERWFDLIRYARQTIADPSAKHKVTALDIITAQKGTPDVNYLVLPIPLYELNNNPLIKQNPGY